MHETPASLSYRLGLAVVRGVPVAQAPSWLVYDDRLDALVAPGHRFVELRAWAAANGLAELAPPERLDAPLLDPREPRPNQREAVQRWRASGARGTVVLPTGAEKDARRTPRDRRAPGRCVHRRTDQSARGPVVHAAR